MWREHMGFAPHDQSEKRFLSKAPVPDQVLELPTPDYFLQLTLILIILAVACGVSVVEPWAKDQYGYQTTSYYVALVGYGFTAATCVGLILLCAHILFFSKPTKDAADMSDDYGTDNVPEGDDYDYSENVLSFVGAAVGAYFVAKMFVMKKAGAAPKKTTEDEALMMYSANTMN